MAERLGRKERRAQERADRKNSAKINSKARAIAEQIMELGRANSGLDLGAVDSQTRAEVTALSADLYLQTRPSQYSQRDLVDSVTFKIGVVEKPPTIARDLMEDQDMGIYMPENYDPKTGMVNVWMGARLFMADAYVDTDALTALSFLPQVLSHAFYHKEAQSPNGAYTGFGDVDSTFNEITTEYLRIQGDERAGFPILSSYPGVTEVLPSLKRVLSQYGLTEGQLFDFFVKRDYMGLAVELGAKKYPREYRMFQRRWNGKYDMEREDENFEKLMTYGFGLINSLKQGIH